MTIDREVARRHGLPAETELHGSTPAELEADAAARAALALATGPTTPLDAAGLSDGELGAAAAAVAAEIERRR